MKKHCVNKMTGQYGRMRRAFLLFPMSINGVRKWLVNAMWLEEHRRVGYSESENVPVRWIESGEEREYETHGDVEWWQD